MSYSYTLSETRTFTVTHARHMAAKVATDLKRMQRLYGSPAKRHRELRDRNNRTAQEGLPRDRDLWVSA